MQALDEEMEIIHLYVVREQPKKPYTVLPLLGAFLCLLGIVEITLYSAQHPSYEHQRLTVPAVALPLKIFTASAPITPTGIKAYPATYAHGYLTFSNGSVIGQSVPAGFTIDGAATDSAVYVPPATANGFGIATIPAHLLTSGINMSTLSISEVIGASLFVRNLSPFTGGKPGYSISYVTTQDKQTAVTKARNLLAITTHIGYHYPCEENQSRHVSNMVVTWHCQFVTFRVPSYMRVLSARLAGANLVLDVVFTPLPTRVWVR